MRQFKNNLKRNRRNHSDRIFKRSSDVDRLNGNFANNDNSFRRSINRGNGNVQKLISKYNDLAREALSSGDKILSENYFQHADHFTRIQVENDNYKKIKFSHNDDKNLISTEEVNKISGDKDKKDNFSENENIKVDKTLTEVN